MRYEQKNVGPALVPAGDGVRKLDPLAPNRDFIYYGEGTPRDVGYPLPEGIGLWLTRWQKWRDGFEQAIGPRVRRYWNVYRAFDNGLLPGPNQEWRDRTVIPSAYKIIETRIPRLILSQFGGRNWFRARVRGEQDEDYEEMVRQLLDQSFDEVGTRDHHDGGSLKRIIDGIRYNQIMGHVFWKVWWRSETRKVKTKVPTIFSPEGKPERWETVEFDEKLYDNVDFTWIPLDSIAIDLSGTKKWVIERIHTSLEHLKAENAEYQRLYGEPLYHNLDQIHRTGPGPIKDSYEEPRDTEHWPLGEEHLYGDPGETDVELWLCWDNRKGTCTKIADRTVLLDHGKSDTPDGLDPYISHPAVPIPGRVYGESLLHYIAPLTDMQSRIARARMDEVLLNIWQQFIYRAGSVRNNKMLFIPGGAVPIEDANTERPISDHFSILPRRPIFNEAWTEEGYRAQQAESTAGADAIAQGTEATQKSRDVAATEIQQRMLGANARFNMESLYLEVVFKRPLLQKMFDLLRQNLTDEKVVRVLGKERRVSLMDLERPIDVVLGGNLQEGSKQEETQQVDQLVQLAQSPVFGPYMKPREILLEWFETRDRRDATDLVKTEEEVQREQAQQMAMAAMQQAAAAPPQGGGGGSGSPPRRESAQAKPDRPNGPGGGQLAGPRGEEPKAPPSASGRLETTI